MERNDFMRPVEIRRPQAPQSLNFAVREIAEEFELRMARTPQEREQVFERLKQRAAYKMADYLFKNCKFFEVPDLMSRDLKLQIEITIEDRGAYENWIPVAEQRGKALGRKQAIKEMVESLPYGMADAAREFYE